MPRLNIASLPKPQRGFRIQKTPPRARGKSRFETVERARAEDARRGYDVASFRAALAGPSPRVLDRLVEQLARSGRGEAVPKTLASSAYSRLQRIRVTGAAWEFALRHQHLAVTTATIIPRGWEIPAGELHLVDIRKMLNAVRTDLYRCGAKSARGGLIAFVHGEYEPRRAVYQLHLHALVAGDMIDVVNRLRKRQKYRRQKPGVDRGSDSVRTRVRINRKPLTTISSAFSYLYKSFWVSRVGHAGEDDRPRRNRVGHRLRGSENIEVLLFLDRHRLCDFTLLVHMKVTKRGFGLSSHHEGENVSDRKNSL